MATASRRWLGLAAALALAAGCGQGGKAGEAGPTGPTGPSAQVELQPRAQVADPATRTALRTYDAATGDLHFAPGAAQVAALAPGDVLVSAPTPAAPYGFLRKVTSVTTGASEVVVATGPARLDEVLKNGSGKFHVEIATHGSAAARASGAQPSPGIGIGTRTQFHREYHGDGVDLVVDGQENLSAGADVSVGVDGLCAFDGDPCLWFDADAGLIDDASLSVDATVNKDFDETWNVVSLTGDPITFFIGPVPIVLVPRLDVDLHVYGTAHGHLAFASSANGPEVHVGVHWDSSDGFRNTSGARAPSFNPGAIDFQADLDAHARLPAKVRVLLYDAAGVQAVLTPGLDGHFKTPGRPAWTLGGRITGEIGVEASLPILGDLGESNTTLFDEAFQVAQSTNLPPAVSIVLPLDGATGDVTQNTNVFALVATASDPEDGPDCCTITWSAGGSAIGTGKDLAYTFARPGTYTLTATATDSDGASTTSAPVTVTIATQPPGARFLSPAPACMDRVYAGIPTRLAGTNGGWLGLTYTCAFASDLPSDSPPFPLAVNKLTAPLYDRCDVDARFTGTGTRNLTLTVTQVLPDGSPGASSQVSGGILVQDPPPGKVPVLRTPGPGACAQEPLDVITGSLVLYLEGYGGTGATATTWTWEHDGCAPVAVPSTHRLGMCTPGYCPTAYTFQGADLYAAAPSGPCGGLNNPGRLTVTMTDATGAKNSTYLWVSLVRTVIN